VAAVFAYNKNIKFGFPQEVPMAGEISLRAVQAQDLPIFFEQQLDPTANTMAAFTAKDPSDRQAFDKHWAKITADDGILIRTILSDGQVAGSILSHAWFGDLEVSYWIGREFWGRGIATTALRLFLEQQTERPIFARVVKDNLGSRRVLEKNGFVVVGEDRGFANARGQEVEELIYQNER
jgi:RimJ/RimL family protein N-acetyltransferase